MLCGSFSKSEKHMTDLATMVEGPRSRNLSVFRAERHQAGVSSGMHQLPQVFNIPA